MARKEKTLQFRLIFGIFRHLWTKSSILLPFYYQWKSGLLPAESGQYYFESSRCGVKTDDNEAKVADVSAKVTHVCADSVDIWAKLADLWSKLVDNRSKKVNWSATFTNIGHFRFLYRLFWILLLIQSPGWGQSLPWIFWDKFCHSFSTLNTHHTKQS